MSVKFSCWFSGHFKPILNLLHPLPTPLSRQFWSRPAPNRPPPGTPGVTFSIVRPHPGTPQLAPDDLPPSITPPPYFRSGVPPDPPSGPEVKSPEAIECMRRSCSLARSILSEVGRMAVLGNTTDMLDQKVMELAFEAGAYPSPLNYRNFPKSVCTSVNNVVCHGIPDSRPLEDGDIVNIDITVFYNNYHGDCSETFLVGEVDEGGIALVNVAREALQAGVESCGPGRPIAGIGMAVEKYVSSKGFKVIPAFTGHGIGTYFHGPPDIYPCRNSYPGKMKPGMTFTIEPCVSEGSTGVHILGDRWTAVSPDSSRSAQFEHTVLVTEEGVDILTLR